MVSTKKPLYDEKSEALGKRIAHRLKEFREVAKLSPEDVAKRSGISVSGIRKMEKANSNPAIQSLNQYVKACGKTLGEFFEPWLPPGSTQYDQHVHRTISAALKDQRARSYIYSLVEMLRELKVE